MTNSDINIVYSFLLHVEKVYQFDRYFQKKKTKKNYNRRHMEGITISQMKKKKTNDNIIKKCIETFLKWKIKGLLTIKAV